MPGYPAGTGCRSTTDAEKFMNLLGAIVEHQNSLLRFYRKLEERFEENSIIRALWHDLADDVSLQIQSLKSLPSSLWNQFKNAPDDSFESAAKKAPSQTPNVAEISLRDGFEISLQLTEPVVLKIYARVVKLLRKNSTAPALNFYILVKSYVARLVRTTESFTGDPMLARRAQMLLQGLEKEVQEPAQEARVPAFVAPPPKAQKIPVAVKKDARAVKINEKAQTPAKPAKPARIKLVKPSKIVPAKPAKPVPVKPAKPAPAKPAKPAPVKPAKPAPVKTKALPGKKPAPAKRG